MQTKRTYKESLDVKGYVRPARVITDDICPGCLRPKPIPSKRFCDRFCEELYRLNQERRARSHVPANPLNKCFFVASATNEKFVCSAYRPLTPIETAQYEPKPA